MSRSRHLESCLATSLIIGLIGSQAIDEAAKPHTHAAAHAQVGRASYYGPSRGHPKTASGARLRAGAMTAASRNLPLGARAKVTDLKTGKSVNVVVTDRGPYAKGRILDVSRAAAGRLGMTRRGVATVAIRPTASPGRHSS